MKRLLTGFIFIFFALATTEVFSIVNHLTVEVKCPKCKMTIAKKGPCPCCHKKKSVKKVFLHDPCAESDDTIAIHFDRLVSTFAAVAHVAPISATIFINPTNAVLVGTFVDIPYPPPQI